MDIKSLFQRIRKILLCELKLLYDICQRNRDGSAWFYRRDVEKKSGLNI